LYECNKSLLINDPIAKACRQVRPGQEELERAWTTLQEMWMEMLERVPSFHSRDAIPTFDRNRQNGGELTARPIGQKAICRAVGMRANIEGSNWNIIFGAINRTPVLDQEPWKGLLWNPEDGSMFAGKERMELASNILLFWMGFGDRDQLVDELRTVTSGTANLPA
jgi:hypothetical protein